MDSFNIGGLASISSPTPLSSPSRNTTSWGTLIPPAHTHYQSQTTIAIPPSSTRYTNTDSWPFLFTASLGGTTSNATSSVPYVTLLPDSAGGTISSSSTVSSPTIASIDSDPDRDLLCFPNMGGNDEDKLIEIAQPSVGDWCGDPDLIHIGIRDLLSPPRVDSIVAGWVIADDAREECHDLPSVDSSSVSYLVCWLSLGEIVKTCPWNGGVVRNACGEFWIKACPGLPARGGPASGCGSQQQSYEAHYWES